MPARMPVPRQTKLAFQGGTISGILSFHERARLPPYALPLAMKRKGMLLLL